MQEQYFYLEFTIGNEQRFALFTRFFAAIKREKDRVIAAWNAEECPDDYDPVKDPQWLDYLDEEAIEWFSDTFDFAGEEGRTYSALWELTDPKIRISHPMFNHPGNWDFESMIDAIFSGEYVLIGLEKESEEKGVLYYDPWAGPFGGSECLVALIESFGNVVTYDSWCHGPHQRPSVGWDYELARQLVAEGRGFTIG